MIKFFKKHKMVLLIVLLLTITLASTLGRFVYDEIKKNILKTQNFYFESDKLRSVMTLYQINNYNGVDNYDILINMNSIRNNKIIADTDIDYDITFNCSTNANCSASKSSGTIYQTTGTDFFQVSISPKSSMNEGDSMQVYIKASATNPYEKDLSATFKLVVGNHGLSHEINDVANRAYLELKITNTLDYYKVLEVFDNYQIGDKIDIVTYQALSEVNQAKCASAVANLVFDPNVILFDNASGVANLISQTTISLGGFDYVNSFSFKLEPISSVIVRFYKKNAALNYTYPITNPTSIVNVTYPN